jgi:hypothetical protein
LALIYFKMSDLSSAQTIQVGDKMISVPTEHQYKSDITTDASFYMYRKLYPLVAPTLALNGTCVSEYEITPGQVFNLSKSFLEAEITFPTTGVATIYNVAHTGFCAYIDQIEYLDASGKQLVWIQNPQYYTKIVWPACTPQEDFLANSVPNAFATVEAAGLKTALLNRSNVVPAVGVATLGGCVNTDVAGSFTFVPANTPLEANTGIQHGIVGIANSALVVRLQVPLGQMYGTLFSCNKDLYFGQTTTIRITWNQSIKMGYKYNSTGNALTNLADPLTIQSDRIRLAQQANPIAAESIKADVNTKGINLCVPFVWTYKYSINGATAGVNGGAQQSMVRKINKGHGQRLLRVWTAQFNSQADSGLPAGGYYANYCQNQNFANFCFSEVYAQLDGNNLQENNLLNANGEVYEFLQQKLEGSAGGSVNQYLSSAYMLNDFTPWKTIDFAKSDTQIAGLSLAEEREYQITFRANQIGTEGSNLFYMFVVCQRVLTIDKMGTTFA